MRIFLCSLLGYDCQYKKRPNITISILPSCFTEMPSPYKQAVQKNTKQHVVKMMQNVDFFFQRGLQKHASRQLSMHGGFTIAFCVNTWFCGWKLLSLLDPVFIQICTALKKKQRRSKRWHTNKLKTRFKFKFQIDMEYRSPALGLYVWIRPIHGQCDNVRTAKKLTTVFIPLTDLRQSMATHCSKNTCNI